MNRREILRTGSLGTLGLLASHTFQTALGQARVAGANERIRIGIVGFSDRLKSALLPAYKAVAEEFNCEIVGVSDIWNCPPRGSEGLFHKELRQGPSRPIATTRNSTKRRNSTPSSFPPRISNTPCTPSRRSTPAAMSIAKSLSRKPCRTPAPRSRW